MACSIDHSTLLGLKFCTECGEPLKKAPRVCTQGHELVRTNKFCEVCGSTEAGANAPTPTPTPTPRVTPPLPPQVVPPTNNLDPLPPAPPYLPRKKNHSLILASIGLAVLVIVGIIFNVNQTQYTSVTLTMNIYDESCYNLSWGYFDIPGGENVLYVDGVPVAYADYPSIGMSGGLYCSFTTVFTNVPMDGDYYEVGMSSGRRGRVSNSRAEMESNGWEFDLSLGL